MKRVKKMKGWEIYELSAKEQIKYDFSHAVIHPDVVGTTGIEPNDTDWECNSLNEAISWINNY